MTHTITWKDSFKYDLLAFAWPSTTCSFSIDGPCGISEDPEKEKIMSALKGLMDNGKCRPENARWKPQGLWGIERIVLDKGRVSNSASETSKRNCFGREGTFTSPDFNEE